jgi:hypothetical protein
VQFLIATTNEPCWFRCTFRAAKDEFRHQTLVKQLKLKPWNDRPDVPCFGRYPRVRIARSKSRYDQVTLFLHDRQEMETPAFSRFLRRAVKSYQRMIDKETAKKARKRAARRKKRK